MDRKYRHGRRRVIFAAIAIHYIYVRLRFTVLYFAKIFPPTIAFAAITASYASRLKVYELITDAFLSFPHVLMLASSRIASASETARLCFGFSPRRDSASFLFAMARGTECLHIYSSRGRNHRFSYGTYVFDMQISFIYATVVRRVSTAATRYYKGGAAGRFCKKRR